MVARAAVIGHPIIHSLSPVIFKFLSAHLKMSLDYVALDVPPRQLKEILKEMSQEYIGVNVTIPHKEKILDLCHEVSDEVSQMGAANVLKFDSGKIKAFNTDIFGVTETFKQNSVDLKGKDILILGSGGAARAGGYAAGLLGSKSVSFLNRNYEKSEILTKNLKDFFSTRFFALHKASDVKGDLAVIINSTPVGMEGFNSKDPEKYFADIFQSLTPPPVAFDMVYNPENTPFLRVADRLKCKGIGGMDMLVHQALETWRIWFKPAEISDKIRSSLTDEIKNQIKKKTIQNA